MERIAVESIPIMVGREEDGRWWADIESMPGVMAYGATREGVRSFPRSSSSGQCELTLWQ